MTGKEVKQVTLLLALCRADHTVYVTLHFCMKNSVACMLSYPLPHYSLLFPCPFCVQTDAMTFGWVLNIPMNRNTIDDWQVTKGTILEGNCQCGSSSFPWPQYNMALFSTNNYLLRVVSDGLCHYSACHHPDFIMRKNRKTSYKYANWKITKFTFVEV